MSWSDASHEHAARALAARLELPVDPAPRSGPVLELGPDGWQLRLADPGAPGPVSADFGALGHRRRHGSLRGEAIARAVGLRGGRTTHVVDATAGLGRDAFVLASLGAQVTLLERSPILGVLLQDALDKALADPESAPIAKRMRLLVGAAEALLPELARTTQIDVVYLDPMYPEHGTRAQVKKEMQILRQLLGTGDDAEELVAHGLENARRVVLKRPRHVPPLRRKPSHSVNGRSTRFDVYIRHTNPHEMHHDDDHTRS